MKRILLAVGDKNFHDIFRRGFASYTKDFNVLPKDVYHRNFLKEMVELEKPDIVIVHDFYLQSDLMEEQSREKEWLKIMSHFRHEYNDTIRVVFIGERSFHNPFLKRLIQWNVLDIVNDQEFMIDDLIQQLQSPASFKNVAQYMRNPNTPVDVDSDPSSTQPKPKEETESGSPEANEHSHSKLKTLSSKMKRPTKSSTDSNPNPKSAEEDKKEVKKRISFQLQKTEKELVGVPVERAFITVISLSRRCGSSFVSHSLAKLINDQGVPASYIENPFTKPYSYDRFFGHNVNESHQSLFSKMSVSGALEEIDEDNEWIHEDVQLINLNPLKESVYSEEEVTLETFSKMFIYMQNRPVTVLDVGADYDRTIIKDLLNVSTHTYVVSDGDIPLLTLLTNSQKEEDEGLYQLRTMLENDEATFVLNRGYTEGYRTLLKEIGITSFFSVMNMSEKHMFQGQEKGSFFANKDHQVQVYEQFEPMLKEILPKEYLKKPKSSFRFSKLIKETMR